jgi:hypothetical protein
LRELIERVAADTGAPLTAARDVADEPVTVVVKEMPARELLEQLADLLDYRWSKRGAGQADRLPGGKDRQAASLPHYEIWQDLPSKQREEAPRQAALRNMEKRFQEELKRYVEVAALSPEKLQEFEKMPFPPAGELQNLSVSVQKFWARRTTNRQSGSSRLASSRAGAHSLLGPVMPEPYSVLGDGPLPTPGR